MSSEPRSTSFDQSNTTSRPLVVARRTHEWRFVAAITAIILLITSVPFIVAAMIAPSGYRFMGIMLGIEDHLQYFAWMRDLSHQFLAADRMTPEPNSPAMFNLLWWAAGRFGVWTGLNYAALFSILRVLGILACIICVYLFFCQTLSESRQRKLALVIFSFGGGLGIIWVITKYLFRLADAPFPIDIETAEPNTFRLFFAFPHFTIALSLIIAVLGLFLQGVRTKQYRYVLLAGVASLVLSLQHAYDLFTIYTVLGLFGLLQWRRDRAFPWFTFWSGVIITAFSAPFAASLLLLVKGDPIWAEVLSQFDNVGVFSPSLYHLPILLGVPFLLALAMFRPRMLLSEDDGEMLVVVWFLAHFPLIYLPTDFQIHMFLGWQVPIAILAARAVFRYVPDLSKQWRVSQSSLVALVLALSVVTNVYLVAWRFVDLARIKAPYYMTTDEIAALDWLQANTTNQDVVLATLRFGQFVPMWSDARGFVSHWANTVRFFEKREQAQLVLSDAVDDQERQQLLREYAVTYLVVSPNDEQPPTIAAGQLPYLQPVFQQGAVTIYRTHIDQ